MEHEVHEMERDIQADVDAVMKKYDRESNTRVWEGVPKLILRGLMAAFSVYCILMTLFSKALPGGPAVPVYGSFIINQRLPGLSPAQRATSG